MTPTARPQRTWGGARAGAGRPRTSPFVPHESRPPIERREVPVEIELKLRRGWGNLRAERTMRVFLRASARARRFGLRILHYQVKNRGITLICEFKNRDQLERSFKSLNTTLAIALKMREERRTKRPHRGPVFLDRYRLTLLDSPLALRDALKRVLLRERGLDRGGRLYFAVSPSHSSSAFFSKWAELLGPEADQFRRRAGKALFEAAHAAFGTRVLASPQFRLSRYGWYGWAKSERRFA